MGVKDLWNVLSPIAQKTSLYELQDKVIAIDLSCWVCEGQIIGEKAATQPRMYLRNLFFRTQTLLMINVTPIFVLEGEAPALKLDTMKQRNDARFKKYRSGHVEGTERKNIKPGRSRFLGILKNCQKMLEMMGVTCIQSEGEAEALCGQLSREKIAHGVMSQDSDVFLYGATAVYRNLSVKCGVGTVNVYLMRDIELKLNLTREKLVAMSLLCGCDYDQAGVQGIGKEIAFKYLSSFRGDILKRLRSLKEDEQLKRLEEEKYGCSKCSHPGKLSEHKKDGCFKCDLAKGCAENDSIYSYKNLKEAERKIITVEITLRNKALTDETFPNEETINEFLNTNQNVLLLNPQWLKPNVRRFSQFCTKMLEWEIEYCVEKLLPLLSRWLLLNSNSFDGEEMVPQNIVKKRIVKGVASYDLAWKIIDENLLSFLSIMPVNNNVLNEEVYVSVEPQILITSRLDKIYNDFIEKTTKKKPARTKKVKAQEQNVTYDIGFGNLSVKSPAKNTSSPEKESLHVTFGLFDLSGIDEVMSNSVPGDPIKTNTKNKIDSSSESLCMGSLNINETINIEDDSTVEYDLSTIVDNIIARRQF